MGEDRHHLHRWHVSIGDERSEKKELSTFNLSDPRHDQRLSNVDDDDDEQALDTNLQAHAQGGRRRTYKELTKFWKTIIVDVKNHKRLQHEEPDHEKIWKAVLGFCGQKVALTWPRFWDKLDVHFREPHQHQITHGYAIHAVGGIDPEPNVETFGFRRPHAPTNIGVFRMQRVDHGGWQMADCATSLLINYILTFEWEPNHNFVPLKRWYVVTGPLGGSPSSQSLAQAVANPVDPDHIWMIMVYDRPGRTLPNIPDAGAAAVLMEGSKPLSLFIQLIFSFAVAEERLKFIHGDLQPRNLFLLETERDWRSYRFNGNDYWVRTHGIQLTIIDFSKSSLKFNVEEGEEYGPTDMASRARRLVNMVNNKLGRLNPRLGPAEIGEENLYVGFRDTLDEVSLMSSNLEGVSRIRDHLAERQTAVPEEQWDMWITEGESMLESHGGFGHEFQCGGCQCYLKSEKFQEPGGVQEALIQADMLRIG